MQTICEKMLIFVLKFWKIGNVEKPEKPLDMDYVDDQVDDDEGPEIEMNWNLVTYLPEVGACQKNFNTVIAGYITANHQFLEDEAVRVVPGSTPVRKRMSSQSQDTPVRRLSQATGQPLTATEYAQDLVTGTFILRKHLKSFLKHSIFYITQQVNLHNDYLE